MKEWCVFFIGIFVFLNLWLVHGKAFNQPLRIQHPITTSILSYYLEVEPDWQIYIEESGNPHGYPVLFIHGGPGSFFKKTDHQWFNPSKYRIIAFDQRGSGRSKPSAQNPIHHPKVFATITMGTLAADIEKIRKHLRIEKFLVFGGSWGSTLALFYAQEYPSSVSGLVLRGIYLGTEAENDLFYSKKLLIDRLGKEWNPASFNLLVDYAKSKKIEVDPYNSQSLLNAYKALVIEQNDSKAMHLWSGFEDYVDQLTPERLENLFSYHSLDPEYRSTAIFQTLFFSQLPSQLNLLDDSRIEKLKTIPIFIVQGCRDTVCPQEFAKKLVSVLKQHRISVELRLVDDGAHSPYSPNMMDALIRITDDFSNKPL